jgi:hypothetical protein
LTVKLAFPGAHPGSGSPESPSARGARQRTQPITVMIGTTGCTSHVGEQCTAGKEGESNGTGGQPLSAHGHAADAGGRPAAHVADDAASGRPPHSGTAAPTRGRAASQRPMRNLVGALPVATSIGASVGAATGVVDAAWCTNGGDRHDWQRWHQYTPVNKYRCGREGCGFFKKCWPKCKDADTTCNGCHVIGHKRW